MKISPKENQYLTFPIIDKWKDGDMVEDVKPMLYSLFKPSIQTYLGSWFKYNPQDIKGSLSIPTLIIQGTNDLQVTVDEAITLAKAQPKSTLVFIEDINHVLKIIDEDPQKNAASYNNPDLPNSEELIKSIIEHIYSK
ncbi:MAG: alpha/beta fold hydrolase [Nitritalea sp.]